MEVHYDAVGGGQERYDPANVLILGGWSSAQLDTLRRKFGAACVFYEPTLYMPPVDFASLFMWESILLAAVAALMLSLIYAQSWPSQLLSGTLMLRMPLAFALLMTIPTLVVLIARGAIRRSVDIAAAAISKHAIDVVVGYSWGGGVACFLLGEGRWSGASLLLAPTLHAMTGAARLPTPTPFFVAPHRGQPTEMTKAAASEGARGPGSSQVGEEEEAASSTRHQIEGRSAVYIFHADDDGFCPERQRHELQQTGAQCRTMRDTHDLMARQSDEEIGRAFADLILQVRPDWGTVRGVGV